LVIRSDPDQNQPFFCCLKQIYKNKCQKKHSESEAF
jgi:hypothetical protein